MDTPCEPLALETEERAKQLRTLLVVDDDAGPRQALFFLFKNDYQVLLAENGLKALDLVKSHAVDAAILDLRMPIMSGSEVLNQLKKLDPAIEVIILTPTKRSKQRAKLSVSAPVIT
ncbi:MAG: response regulator [Verrucomicrobia bacterium]|nr:response regulator [Verrucomicrobiota bacterium]